MELIQKYLNGDLSDEEQVEFQQKIKEDPQFAEEVEAATVLMAQYKLQKKQRWQELLEQQEKQAPTEKIIPLGRPRNLLIRRVAAAVMVLLVGTFTYWYFTAAPTVDNMVGEYVADHHIAPSAWRGVGDDKLLWEEARQAYLNKDFQEAVAAITQLQQTAELDAEQQFYLGLSYLYLPSPDHKKAIDALLLSRQMNELKFGQQANWYLSLSYLQQGDREKARELLQNIINNDNWHVEEARKLRDQLIKER